MQTDKKVNILYVITSLNIGGTEKMLLATLKGLNREKYTPLVCCLKRLGPYGSLVEQSIGKENLFSLGFSETPGIYDSAKYIVGIFKLIYLLKNKQIDIIHSYLFQANLWSRIAGRIAGIPIIISSIRVMEIEKKFQLLINRLTNYLVDKIITNSISLTQFTIEKENVSPKKIITIPNGINITEINGLVRQDNKSTEMISELFYGLDRNNIFIVGAVGRLHTQKGIEYLLGAADIVKKAKNNVKFLVIGDGPSGNDLRLQSKKMGLQDTVVFTGWKSYPETVSLMNCIDLFVLPSLWEGMPNVLMESMVLGKPVVATDIGGVTELVKDKETGLIIPPADKEKLAEAILWLVEHLPEAKDMGEKAKEFVARNYSIEKMVLHTEKVYEELVSAKMKQH